MLQRQQYFDHSSNTCRRFKMTNSALNGANGQGSPRLAAQHIPQCLKLNRVTQRCTGAMGFNPVQIVTSQSRLLQSAAQQISLGATIRGGDASTLTIVVQCRSQQFSAQRVAIALCIIQSLKHD
jgi:hypothetical protein